MDNNPFGSLTVITREDIFSKNRYQNCPRFTVSRKPNAATPSIRIKEGRVYPHWACSWSLFGGTGDLTRKGEASDRLPVSFISGVRPLPQQIQARRGRGCIREDMFLAPGRSQGSRCHQDELHAPGLNEARGGLGTAQQGQSLCHHRGLLRPARRPAYPVGGGLCSHGHA